MRVPSESTLFVAGREVNTIPEKGINLAVFERFLAPGMFISGMLTLSPGSLGMPNDKTLAQVFFALASFLPPDDAVAIVAQIVGLCQVVKTATGAAEGEGEGRDKSADVLGGGSLDCGKL